MDGQTTKLIELIEVLREKVGPQGEYSICKTDGGTIDLFEALEMGSIFEAIDETLVAIKKDE